MPNTYEIKKVELENRKYDVVFETSDLWFIEYETGWEAKYHDGFKIYKNNIYWNKMLIEKNMQK